MMNQAGYERFRQVGIADVERFTANTGELAQGIPVLPIEQILEDPDELEVRIIAGWSFLQNSSHFAGTALPGQQVQALQEIGTLGLRSQADGLISVTIRFGIAAQVLAGVR